MAHGGPKAKANGSNSYHTAVAGYRRERNLPATRSFPGKNVRSAAAIRHWPVQTNSLQPAKARASSRELPGQIQLGQPPLPGGRVIQDQASLFPRAVRG